MTDIAPELLDLIEREYKHRIANNKKLANLLKKVEAGTATHKEALDYSAEVGNTLAEVFKNNLSADILPNGRMYYNIANRVLPPPLALAYSQSVDYACEVQKILNDAAGIGIKPIRPKMNQDRIAGIVDIVSGKDNYDDISYMLKDPVVNLCQSAVDDTVKVNAEFHYEAGLEAKIIRTASSKPCKWCSRMAGKYTYPDVPKDVYRRHKNCNCIVEYVPVKGQRQNVHTKKFVSDEELERRKTIGLETPLKKDSDEILAVVNERLKYGTSDAEQKKINRVKQDMTKQLELLEPDEKDIITRMTGSLSGQINLSIFRNKAKYLEEQSLIDDALAKGVITENLTLYRKTDIGFLDVLPNGLKSTESELKEVIGKTITNRIYTSTSLYDLQLSARNTEIILDVPKGTKGALYVKPLAHNKYKEQEEILFSRNLKYKVTSTKIKNNKIIIEAEVIGYD